jgi:hypothetical protein
VKEKKRRKEFGEGERGPTCSRRKKGAPLEIGHISLRRRKGALSKEEGAHLSEGAQAKRKGTLVERGCTSSTAGTNLQGRGKQRRRAQIPRRVHTSRRNLLPSLRSFGCCKLGSLCSFLCCNFL